MVGGMSESPTLTGSCLCGDIAFAITGPLVTFQYCHCSRCQKWTGSAHASNAFVKPEHFEWTRGGDGVGRFELPDAKYFCTGFCKRCGSSMPWMNRTGTMMICPAGAFDGEPEIQPKRAIFCAARPDWYVNPFDIEQLEELPPRRKK